MLVTYQPSLSLFWLGVGVLTFIFEWIRFDLTASRARIVSALSFVRCLAVCSSPELQRVFHIHVGVCFEYACEYTS